VIFGLPDPARVRRALDMLGSVPRRQWSQLRARRRARIRERDVWLTNASGYRINAHVHEPDDDERRPAVLLAPGREQTGDVFCSGSTYLLAADEIAVLGIRVVHFDPVGRGRSWGQDDFCGVEGQDSLRTVLEYLHARRDVLRGRIGVVSFSMGLALAAPVLVREGARLGTSFLLDWEGPADREAILRTGALPPAARAALADDPARFWRVREPIGWIGRLPCRYVRIQGFSDHGLERRGRLGAIDLVGEAVRGGAPSVELNDNPPDVPWRREQADELKWAPEAAGPLNRLLVEQVRRLVEAEHE
jgi:pimeloyl-ACP methyl ester carboxylesterase